MSVDLRESLDRLLARHAPGPDADRAFLHLGEGVYRDARGTAMEELRDWLSVRVERAPALRPWLALVRLAAAPGEGDVSWRQDFAEVEAEASRFPGRTALVLRTEAARHLQRLEGAAATWERLRDEPLPDATLAEIAVDAVVVRLRLAAAAGSWDEHDRLAQTITPEWSTAAGPSAIRISLTVAEHEISRGLWERALQRLHPLEEHPDEGVRLAALEVGLNARLTAGSDLPGEALQEEIARNVRLLEPLAAGSVAADVIPPEEQAERRDRAARLLRLAESRAQEGEPGDPRNDLAAATAALRTPSGIPEIDLRQRLVWVLAALAVHGRSRAGIGESLLTSVILEAHLHGLPELELRARELLAALQDWWFEGRWADLAEAGRAANLAALLLARNPGGLLERPLRANLLPVFDHAVVILAERALSLAAQRAEEEGFERIGRALLDYAEQSMKLALSEARSRIRAEGSTPELFPVFQATESRPMGNRELQAPLRPGEAVLQYFLAGRFLLLFAYGRDFFLWGLDSPPGAAPDHPLPVRVPFERDLAVWRLIQEGRAGLRHLALVMEHPLPRDESPEEVLERLAGSLLPASLFDALEVRGIRRLIIVPHDVLYRAPFGLLPWRGTRLGTRFGLSLQPTGALAGSHSATSWRRPERRLRVGFVIGPDLDHADQEGDVLTSALGRGAEVLRMDTRSQGTQALEGVRACDILYFACHGAVPGANADEASLLLGREDEEGSMPQVPLSRVASLPLAGCALVILQSCWTGWMVHLREAPVQGFPQAFLDAGARAVVAPMLPVADALCPIFAAVYGRMLRFLPACEALAHTLDVLRRHGPALVAGDSDARTALQESGSFDTFEYRFTGDPDIHFGGRGIGQAQARLLFHAWLLGRRIWNHPWALSARGWWHQGIAYLRW